MEPNGDLSANFAMVWTGSRRGMVEMELNTNIMTDDASSAAVGRTNVRSDEDAFQMDEDDASFTNVPVEPRTLPHNDAFSPTFVHEEAAQVIADTQLIAVSRST